MMHFMTNLCKDIVDGFLLEFLLRLSLISSKVTRSKSTNLH